jgi:hypothetical protein
LGVSGIHSQKHVGCRIAVRDLPRLRVKKGMTYMWLQIMPI